MLALHAGTPGRAGGVQDPGFLCVLRDALRCISLAVVTVWCEEKLNLKAPED